MAIVGGGIAGLAAAYELECRQVPYVLLERTARLGGVIHTERVGDFTVDAGPDALLAQKPAAVNLAREVGLGDRLIPTSLPRTAFIFRAGRLHPLPEASVLGIPTRFAPFALSGLFSTRGKVRMACELVVAARREPDVDESIGSFIRRRFGQEAATYLAEPLLAGIHSGDVDRLSMRALFPRLVAAEQTHGSLIRAFRSIRTHQGGDGAFRSFPGGLIELVDALATKLRTGRVRTSVGVETIAPTTDGFSLRLSTGESLDSRSALLAVPVHAAAHLVQDFDPELSRLCGGIPCVSTATVALAYDRPSIGHRLQGSGFVVPRVEPGLQILAGSWVSSKWAGRAPAGAALLRVFFGGARDPRAVERSDDELSERAHHDLAAILDIRAAPIWTRVYRWRDATAQHEVGHLAVVAAIERRLAAWPGLRLTGSGFRGTGIPDCVADARAQASALADHAARA